MASASTFSVAFFTLDEATKSAFFPSLHRVVNCSFAAASRQLSSHPAWEPGPVPSLRQRLGKDTQEAEELLRRELGPEGFLAVAFSGPPLSTKSMAVSDASSFEGREIVACAGVMPAVDSAAFSSRLGGSQQADAPTVSSPTVIGSSGWELTAVAVLPSFRGRQLVPLLIDAIAARLKPRQSEGTRLRLVVRTADDLNGDYWRKLGFVTLEDQCFMVTPGPKLLYRIPGTWLPKGEMRVFTGEKYIE